MDSEKDPGGGEEEEDGWNAESWRHQPPCTRAPTWGGLALSNQKGAVFISGRQKQPLALLPAYVLEEPPAGARGHGGWSAHGGRTCTEGTLPYLSTSMVSALAT